MDHLHYLYPQIRTAQILAEMARETQQRQSFYPRRVEAGRMRQQDADHELAAMAAIRADLHRYQQWCAGAQYRFSALCTGGAIQTMPAPQHAMSWQDRTACITRELDFRTRFYPGWIGEGKITSDTARHRTECFAALLCWYEDGFDWRAANGGAPLWAHTKAAAPHIAARQEWHRHAEKIHHRRNPATQNELAI